MDKLPCLLLHGFTGGPFEVEPLAEHLRGTGRTCVVPTLPGHGGDLSQLRNVVWTEWVNAAVREAERLVEEHGGFDLVGFSMGGLISAYLANRYPVKRLVLLNAAVVFVSPGRLARSVRMRIKNKDWQSFAKLKGTPLVSTVEFVKLAWRMWPEFRSVQVPSLIVQGDLDEVVHPVSASFVYNNMRGPKEIYLFPKSNHLICLGEEVETLSEIVERFLEG